MRLICCLAVFLGLALVGISCDKNTDSSSNAADKSANSNAANSSKDSRKSNSEYSVESPTVLEETAIADQVFSTYTGVITDSETDNIQLRKSQSEDAYFLFSSSISGRITEANFTIFCHNPVDQFVDIFLEIGFASAVWQEKSPLGLPTKKNRVTPEIGFELPCAKLGADPKKESNPSVVVELDVKPLGLEIPHK